MGIFRAKQEQQNVAFTTQTTSERAGTTCEQPTLPSPGPCGFLLLQIQLCKLSLCAHVFLESCFLLATVPSRANVVLVLPNLPSQNLACRVVPFNFDLRRNKCPLSALKYINLKQCLQFSHPSIRRITGKLNFS